MARALNMIWKSSPVLAMTFATVAVGGGVVPPAVALLQRDILNGITGHIVSGSVLVTWAVGLAGVGMVASSLPFVVAYMNAQLGRVLSIEAQDRLFRAINSLPGLGRFETPWFMDKLQLARGVCQTGPLGFLTSGFGVVQSAISVAGLLGALLFINRFLAALVVGSALPAVVLEFVMSRKQADLQWKLSPAARRQMFYSNLQTDSRAAKEVRLFGIGDFLRVRMLAELQSICSGQRRLDRQNSAMQVSLSTLSSLIIAGGLIWTVREAWSGRLSVGDVSLFILAGAGVLSGLSSMVRLLASGYQSLILFGHYLDIVTAEPDLPISADPLSAGQLQHGIEMRDVWFRYSDDADWVLRGVDLFIPAGKSVALVGLNGAGKSTLVKLLCRLYDPTEGVILWDGADIRRLQPAEFRDHIGALFQDYMAYDLTATENIGLGDLGKLDDPLAIRRAAAAAMADEMVRRLPRGYDTLLSRIFFDSSDERNLETGVVLSGGEWQRLALARGLMRANRDLLILDEPSSGLDAEVEYRLSSQLREIRKGRTSLLISHRLGTIRDADIILVISDGQIIETGSHAELMDREGEYHRLYGLQSSGYQSEPTQAPMSSPAPVGFRLDTPS